MNNLSTNNYQESLIEAIKSIDTTEDWSVEDGAISKVLEEQKVYFWIRLFVTEESPKVEIGSDITIVYKPQNIGIVCEELETKFICCKESFVGDFSSVSANFSLQCAIASGSASKEINTPDSSNRPRISAV